MKHIHNILYCLFLLAGLSSCIADTILDDPRPSGGEPNNAQVMLSLSVPNTQLPAATRALTNDAAISSLYLLVFEDDVLSAKTDITSKYLSANNGTFYVAVKETDKQVRFSIVANTTVLSAVGTTRTATLGALTFSNASDLTSMPMYGEVSQTFSGLSRDNTYDVSVSLVRALSKIEVQYNSTQTTQEFEFLDIEILNTNGQGYIATGQGAFAQSPIGSIAIAPSMINGQKIASAYVAETTNNSPNKISILIRGKYFGTEGYYRLDMIKDAESTEIPGLVRNFKYVFVLQNINFAGRTRSDALSGDPDNKAFDAQVMTLSADEGDILNITTDDEFFLGVNTATLQLVNNGSICFAKLKILTNNYLAGWKIVDAPLGVTFNPGITGGTAASDAARQVSSVWVYINTAVVTQDFTFYVTSGKIRKVINVKLP